MPATRDSPPVIDLACDPSAEKLKGLRSVGADVAVPDCAVAAVADLGNSGSTAAASPRRGRGECPLCWNTETWTFVNPQNDASYRIEGSTLYLSVPAGVPHDVYAAGDNGIRLMQSLADTDFAVETKFLSSVNVSAPYQEQGILVEQDTADFVRFSINSNNLFAFLYVVSISNGNATMLVNQVVRNGPTIYMRVRRRGAAWAFTYSYDSTHWTPAFTFNLPFHPSNIGPYAGNAGYKGTPAPAFTAIVDYFVMSGSSPSRSNRTPYPPSPGPPQINVWYGDSQTFGQNGIPQQWINILGDVADFDEVSTLTYSLNGGPPQTLWMGENTVRLVDPGDFNVEIDYASLNPGANAVTITATDLAGRQTIHTVTVNYVSGKAWPQDYSIDWSKAGNIQNVAQIVDGKWEIQPDGSIRTVQTGYDRLIAIGDRASWVNYVVTAELTINSFFPSGGNVGLIVGWQGHTAMQYGQMLPDQPRTGHPFTGWGNYSYLGANGINIYENTIANPETILIRDNSGRALKPGVKYKMKLQVQGNNVGGSHYSIKVWEVSSAEPVAWDLEADGSLSLGSVVLAVYDADVSFGNLTFTGIHV